MFASNLYIDFEGKEPQLIEVGVIIDSAVGGLRAYLRLMLPESLEGYSNYVASFSNCISEKRILRYGIPERRVWSELGDIISNLRRPARILGFGRDIASAALQRLMPAADFTGIVFQQVELEDWKVRANCLYHLRAKVVADQLRFCCSHGLRHQLSPKERAGKSDDQIARGIAKLEHGAHCALTDSMELLMKHQQRMLTALQLSWIEFL